jgi:hypothetical protein
MILDAFDPGPLGDFPHFPRLADGSPAWSDTAATDGLPVDGVTPMPRGLRPQDGRLLDVTPRNADGSPLNPPTRLP